MTLYTRASPMDGTQIKDLRQALDLSVQDLARLLDCREQTIRNLESPQAAKHPSRQMALLLHLLTLPGVRTHLDTLARHRQA